MPGASGWPESLSASSGGCSQRAAQHAFDLAARHAAGPQQHRHVETSDNGGFRRRPRPRRRRRSGRCGRQDRFAHARPWSARHAGKIGRRRHHRPAEGAQDLPRHRMGGNPQRHGVEAGGGKFGHRAAGRLRQHQRQRSRPERLAPAPAPARRNAAIRRAAARSPTWAISGLNDGPALGLIEPRDRRRIAGVGAEPIDRLGRKRDQSALP